MARPDGDARPYGHGHLLGSKRRGRFIDFRIRRVFALRHKVILPLGRTRDMFGRCSVVVTFRDRPPTGVRAMECPRVSTWRNQRGLTFVRHFTFFDDVLGSGGAAAELLGRACLPPIPAETFLDETRVRVFATNGIRVDAFGGADDVRMGVRVGRFRQCGGRDAVILYFGTRRDVAAREVFYAVLLGGFSRGRIIAYARVRDVLPCGVRRFYLGRVFVNGVKYLFYYVAQNRWGRIDWGAHRRRPRR